MGVLDRFLPPPGAPSAVRNGASCWRASGRSLTAVADAARSGSAGLTTGWRGPAKDAFTAAVGSFLHAVDQAAVELRSVADLLHQLADSIEQAQAEYHHRAALVVGTGVAAVLLTPVTFGASDELGAGAVGVELAAATELATTAASSAAAALAELCAQAARLALQAAVFTGVDIGLDAATGAVAYRDWRLWEHLDLRGDVELGLVAALAMPLRAVMMAGAGGLSGEAVGAVGAVSRTAASLAATGLSMASADALVRTALGEHVDPAELAMAAIPVGPRAKRLLDGEAAMIGESGTRTFNTTSTKGDGWRLDVENPAPGRRLGQIHVQDYAGGKWLYDFGSGRFIDMPRKLERQLLSDRRFVRMLEKAFGVLGEEYR